MGSMTHQYSIVLMSTPPLSPPKYWLQIGVQQHLSGLCCVLVGITLPLFGKPARKWIAVCSFSFYIQYVQCENLRNGVDVIFFWTSMFTSVSSLLYKDKWFVTSRRVDPRFWLSVMSRCFQIRRESFSQDGPGWVWPGPVWLRALLPGFCCAFPYVFISFCPNLLIMRVYKP